jgi:hypothetical protein
METASVDHASVDSIDAVHGCRQPTAQVALWDRVLGRLKAFVED